MPKKPRPSRPGLEISRAATGELTLFINGRHVPGNQTMVGLGRTEQPFEDGGPVHNPCAGLNAAARAAPADVPRSRCRRGRTAGRRS